MNNNIVVACETENAEALVENVFTSLDERIAVRIDKIKTTIGSKILKECMDTKGLPIPANEETDTYDKQEKKIQEAVDFVVEAVLEERSDLDSTIKEASSKYEVSEEKLKEYFTAFFESVSGDSVHSNDDTPNQDKMNDENADRRMRFEETLRLDDGTAVPLTEEIRNSIKIVYEQLSEENQIQFAKKLTENRQGFNKMAKFCLQMVKD
jgi:hypothetical protein